MEEWMNEWMNKWIPCSRILSNRTQRELRATAGYELAFPRWLSMEMKKYIIQYYNVKWWTTTGILILGKLVIQKVGYIEGKSKRKEEKLTHLLRFVLSKTCMPKKTFSQRFLTL